MLHKVGVCILLLKEGIQLLGEKIHQMDSRLRGNDGPLLTSPSVEGPEQMALRRDGAYLLF